METDLIDQTASNGDKCADITTQVRILKNSEEAQITGYATREKVLQADTSRRSWRNTTTIEKTVDHDDHNSLEEGFPEFEP